MRILMTTDTYLPRLGGGEYHVVYLRRELQRLGHEVVLVTTEKGSADQDDRDVCRVPYKSPISLFRVWDVLWAQAGQCDLVHAHYSYRLACIAATIAKLKGKPFVITQHGLGLLPQAGAPLWQRIIFKIWRWWSQYCAATIISTSEDLSIDIHALGFGEKIVHIPNGYDASRFTPLLPPPACGDAPTLLSVRRLVPKNGIQYLIAALPAIRERYPRARLISIGGGRLQDALVSLAEELGVSEAITFFGPLAHEELVPFYQQAHVVVFPSTAESTSLACIESMAMEKVIVASRVGGLVELLGSHEERGTLVPLTESEHCNYEAPMQLPSEKITLLSSAIIHVLEHSQDAQFKAKKASDFASKNYSWPRIAAQTIEAFNRAMRSSESHL